MNRFDKSSLAAVRAELNAVLAKYGMEQNLEFALGNIRFTEGSFNTTLTCNIKGAVTREDQILNSVLKAHKLGRQSADGLRKLVGYNSRAKAYPFIYEFGGKRFKCSIIAARQYFAMV